MLENQFIRFKAAVAPLHNEMALQMKPDEPISFIVYDLLEGITFVTPDGTREIGNVVYTTDQKNDYIICHITSYSGLAPNEMFRIKADEAGQAIYSNLLINDPGADISNVKYSCKEDAFGFVFGKTDNGKEVYIQQTIPVRLHSPQFKQEDKIYTKRNGEQVVLYANITKEYEGETDYIPMEWHEKILLALSCDEVYINGERVTKSGNYEIDHENYTTSDCGIKLLRATFKVTNNVTQRNSNY
jgi:hypothetical protein